MNSSSSALSEVFVSYSSRDVDRVVPIVRHLESAGIPVWRDGDRILGGDYYGEEIAEAIAQSKVLLLMCSQAAFGSDNVAQEVRITWDFAHHNVVPLLLERNLSIPIGFRYCLAGKQWIDIVGQPVEGWLPILVAALAKKGVHPRPQPVPTAAPEVEPPPPRAEPAPASVEADSSSNEESPARSAEPESRVPESTGRRGDGSKGPRFHAGERPIPGVDLELVELLGVGGFGEVWKAVNPLVPNMRPVALKFCLDPEAQEYLRHEAATVAQVLRHGQRHEGIVSLLHTYLSADPPALEYEFVAGGNLTDYVRSAAPGIGTLPLPAVGKIVRRLTEIVAFAHRADPPIVHRDLKPANVLVERRGEKALLRIADFGIGGVAATRIIAQTSGSGKNQQIEAMLKGAHTPLYASPQQIAGKRPDPRDDVHALAVIWYQLLVGDLTCGAPSGRKWADALRKRGMTSETIDVLNASFESRAEDRPVDAGELLQRLAALERPRSGSDSQGKSGAAFVPSHEVPPGAEPSTASLFLEVPAVDSGRKATNAVKSPGTASRPSGSRKTDSSHAAYPRIASDGAILLQCDCGKILKVPSASLGTAYLCPVCGESNTVVPSSLGLPARPEDEILEVVSAVPKDVSPPLPLRWDTVFTGRNQGLTPASERRGLLDSLFGRRPWSERAGRDNLLRRSANFIRYAAITFALIALGLTVMGIIVYSIIAMLLDPRDASYFK